MRLDHLLSMENMICNNRVADRSYSSRPKPKRDGERGAQRVLVPIACCSILSDRLAKAKGTQLNNPKYGGVAQLGEHLPCKQGVMGSIPIISTKRTESSPTVRETRYTENLHGLIAQVVRARA